MKVLLINPPYSFDESPTPPFGLMSLAAYILEKGIDIKIVDYIVTPYSQAHVKKIIEEYNPDVVGATAVTMNINKAVSILKDYKEGNPDLTIVVGGPHVSFDAENILNNNNHIDYIVRGEGEKTFYESLIAISEGLSFRDIMGISFKENGVNYHNDARPFISDINILPYPARQLGQLSKYKALGFPINMITARGCPYRCIFCVGSRMVGRKIRYFDVKRVVDEFEMLASLGFKQINIVDDLFTSNKKRCMDICDEILRRGIIHLWNGFARVDSVSLELLQKLKESGCTTLCFGIETGNQEILNTIKKKTTLDKIQRAIDLCNEAGIEPMSSYILGLPGETPETVEKSLEFAEALNPNYGFHVLSPFPGTEVREKNEAYGIKIFTDDWDRYDANQSVCETEFISSKEIDKIANKFNTRAREYFFEIKEKQENGENLLEKDQTFLNGLEKFAFAKDLIEKELLENYTGIDNEANMEEVINDFILFIEKNTSYSKDVTRQRLLNLFKLNCIKVKSRDGNTEITWV